LGWFSRKATRAFSFSTTLPESQRSAI